LSKAELLPEQPIVKEPEAFTKVAPLLIITLPATAVLFTVTVFPDAIITV
jgi:hypothetical protein